MQNSTPSPPQQADPLQPLQADGRTREPHVDAQIRFLMDVPQTEFWRRTEIRDRESSEKVYEETLVSILRIWSRSGNREDAWKIADILVERSARFILQHVACWKRLSSSQVEECIRDVQVRMIQDLMDESRGSEFWEVRFWLCLKRRLLNIVQKYRALAEAEYQPAPIDDGEGHSTDPLDLIADAAQIDVQRKVELREALALLPEQERIAFYLYYYEDWPQQEVAAQLHVTDRTVRNLLVRAENILKQWRNEQIC